MNPHDETWDLLQSTAVVRGTGEVAFRHMARLVLATAAPEMARALRFMLEAFPEACASREEADARAAAREALHKAGVPLP